MQYPSYKRVLEAPRGTEKNQNMPKLLRIDRDMYKDAVCVSSCQRHDRNMYSPLEIGSYALHSWFLQKNKTARENAGREGESVHLILPSSKHLSTSHATRTHSVQLLNQRDYFTALNCRDQLDT